MKISELIAELEKAKAKHGDAVVYMADSDLGLEDVESVYWRPHDPVTRWVQAGYVIDRG